MLAEERMAIILETINEQKAVKLSQLCEILDASISTVRRDINSLADMGKIVKVHGGAMALDDNFSFIEHNVEEKLALFTEEKIAIAKCRLSAADSVQVQGFQALAPFHCEAWPVTLFAPKEAVQR